MYMNCKCTIDLNMGDGEISNTRSITLRRMIEILLLSWAIF